MTKKSPPIHRFRKLCRTDEDIHAMRYHWFPQSSGLESAEWYMRDYVLIGLVVAGQGMLHEDTAEQMLEAGNLYVVGPRQPYRIDPAPGEGLVEMRILVRPRLADRVAQRYAQQLQSMPWDRSPLASRRQVDDQQLSWAIDWVSSLMDRHCDQLTSEAFLTDFLYRYHQLEQSHPPAQFSKLTDLPAWLRAVLVEMNTAGNLRGGAERLERLTGRSRRHLNRLCQEHFGCSSTNYINRLRLERAARELRFSDTNVEDIAENLGFTNRSYFSRLFRQTYGASPGRYRKTSKSSGKTISSTKERD
jgi:AraC family cel operon transcriptional repressor